MSANGRDLLRMRQRRAPMACDFCRHRKMKCNSQKPICRTCNEHGKRCTYTELVKKPRPSTARISELEQENRRLQGELSKLRGSIQAATKQGVQSNTSFSGLPILTLGNPSSVIPNRACKRCSTSPENQQIAPPSPPSDDGTAARRLFSPDKDSIYHGPTSDLFDEKMTEPGAELHNSETPHAADPSLKWQLVAESAHQRQLETVNLLAGNLDFDGVEPALGSHLLSIYWSRQQSSGPLVYRTVFMRDMASSGPFFSKLLLNAIYFYSCKYTSRIEVRQDPGNQLTAGWIFRQRAVELLRATFDKSSITTIQALIIMAQALFVWCDEKSTSWLYSGMAFNMIIDLGIHVHANSSTLGQRFSGEEIEIRRRVFWSAYVIDKLQSLYQGRPPCLHDPGISLPILFADDMEELELFNRLSFAENVNYPALPRHGISTFTEYCNLCIILDKILAGVYSENSTLRDPGDLLRDSDSIQIELQNWRNSLPSHMDLKAQAKNPLPHMLALLAMFNVMSILLHRPFVSDGHLHSASPSIAANAFSRCCTAAFEIDRILRVYEQSFCFKTAPHILLYATYVSATIHVRLAAQRERGSDAHVALRKCVDILKFQQSVCWTPRRAKRIIDRLIARMGVVVDGPLIEQSDLTLSTFDIDAIIRTFEREQQVSETAHQNSQPHVARSGDGGVVTSISAFPTANSDGLTNNLQIPVDSTDLGLEYDPIFGFDGTTFDYLDFGFGSDFQPIRMPVNVDFL